MPTMRSIFIFSDNTSSVNFWRGKLHLENSDRLLLFTDEIHLLQQLHRGPDLLIFDEYFSRNELGSAVLHISEAVNRQHKRPLMAHVTPRYADSQTQSIGNHIFSSLSEDLLLRLNVFLHGEQQQAA